MPAGQSGTLSSLTVPGIRGRNSPWTICVQAKVYTNSTKSTLLETSANNLCDTDSSGGDYGGTAATGAFNFANTTTLNASTQYFFELTITSGSTNFSTTQSYNTPGGGYSGGQLWDGSGFQSDFDLAFTLEYSAPPKVVLSNYAAATNCYWNSRHNYAVLIQAGTTSTITQTRMQFEASAQDSDFLATRVQIYTNNAGVAGSLVGTLYPSTLAAAVTASGASVSTRVGTYTGSTNVTAGTQYWYAVQGSGNVLSMCAAGGMVTQADSWSAVLTNSYYNIRTDGNYSVTAGLPIFAFEVTTGPADTTPPVITGPGTSTASSVATSTNENTTWSNTYTANEWVSWSLSGSDSATFTIDQAGLLSLAGKNFETRTDSNSDGVFTVTVRATDVGNNTSTQTLNLTIDDVDEFPVITFNGGASTHAISVAENQTAVITYSGSDPDAGATLTWYFADNSFDQRKFDLNPSTGVLTFKLAPDYEVPTDTNSDNVYKVNIGLFDGANLATQMLSVTVTNVAESSAVNKPTFSGLIYKGITTSISVVADSPGKVAFFTGEKRIPSCKSITATGSSSTYTATCSFKPSVQGVQAITARLTPSNGMLPSTSTPLFITVLRRLGTR
jgi:hypothetical protein